MRLVDKPEYKQELETAFAAIQELRRTIKYDLRAFDAILKDSETAIRDHLFLVRTKEENQEQKKRDSWT